MRATAFDIEAAIRKIPDHPTRGILFYDLMPLFQSPAGLSACIDRIAAWARDRQPEVVLGAWRAARASAPDMTEEEARLALERLDPLWEELFPAEQARIIRLLVDRVDVGVGGADVRLELEGLASLARDLAATPVEPARVAA